MSLYQPGQLPSEHRNAPIKEKGVIATFHLANGQTKQVRFQHNDPVKLGSRMAMFRIVWDGTYTRPFYSNHARLNQFCENSVNRGFFDFKDEMVPFLDVTKITKQEFDYEVPLDTFIHQGD